MTPRQFPNHPTAKAVGAVAMLCLYLSGMELFSSKVSGAGPESILWRSEYNSAYFEAKNAKRLLWVQFTGPWCPNCRRMEHDSFPQARIVEHAKGSFVPVKLRSDENEELTMKFNLTGLPATVVIDPATQSIVSLHQGYLGPDELDSVFGQAVALRDKRQLATGTQLASAKKSKAKLDRLSQAVRVAYSKLQEQGIRADLVIANLPVAWISSVVKTGGPSPIAGPSSEKTVAQLALAGYCPVSLVSTHKLVPGEAAHTLSHEGKLYRFADASMINLFRKNPDRYIPINDGHCPVSGVEHAKARPGHPRYGILYRERLYLCATATDRTQFLRDPERYALAHVAEKGHCPHCAQKDGVLVQGDPRFGLIRSGKEYWFPNAEHRTAFLSTLSANPKTTRK